MTTRPISRGPQSQSRPKDSGSRRSKAPHQFQARRGDSASAALAYRFGLEIASGLPRAQRRQRHFSPRSRPPLFLLTHYIYAGCIRGYFAVPRPLTDETCLGQYGLMFGRAICNSIPLLRVCEPRMSYNGASLALQPLDGDHAPAVSARSSDCVRWIYGYYAIRSLPRATLNISPQEALQRRVCGEGNPPPPSVTSAVSRVSLAVRPVAALTGHALCISFPAAPRPASVSTDHDAPALCHPRRPTSRRDPRIRVFVLTAANDAAATAAHSKLLGRRCSSARRSRKCLPSRAMRIYSPAERDRMRRWVGWPRSASLRGYTFIPVIHPISKHTRVPNYVPFGPSYARASMAVSQAALGPCRRHSYGPERRAPVVVAVLFIHPAVLDEFGRAAISDARPRSTQAIAALLCLSPTRSATT
ncbi:hypothetical protein C8Q78DRAFT_532514 [Trametes maxima]|nr:hypothetical protein C8Q78DRAFT_532514 [Trametes maxima]